MEWDRPVSSWQGLAHLYDISLPVCGILRTSPACCGHLGQQRFRSSQVRTCFSPPTNPRHAAFGMCQAPSLQTSYKTVGKHIEGPRAEPGSGISEFVGQSDLPSSKVGHHLFAGGHLWKPLCPAFQELKAASWKHLGSIRLFVGTSCSAVHKDDIPEGEAGGVRGCVVNLIPILRMQCFP